MPRSSSDPFGARRLSSLCNLPIRFSFQRLQAPVFFFFPHDEWISRSFTSPVFTGFRGTSSHPSFSQNFSLSVLFVLFFLRILDASFGSAIFSPLSTAFLAQIPFVLQPGHAQEFISFFCFYVEKSLPSTIDPFSQTPLSFPRPPRGLGGVISDGKQRLT